MKLRSRSHCKGEASYHIVFCPKYRHAIFYYLPLKRLCERNIYQVADKYGFKIRALEVMPDHVHAFVSIPPNISLSNVLHAIRGTTGFKFFRAFPWLKEYKPGHMRFWGGHFWSRGYFFRSVVSTTDEAVEFYIKVSQKEHLKEKYYSHGGENQRNGCSEDPYVDFLKGKLQFNSLRDMEESCGQAVLPKGQLTFAAFT